MSRARRRVRWSNFAVANCNCTHICQKQLRKDSRLCAPADLHFRIGRQIWSKDVDGGADREDEWLPGHYGTLEAAMDVVRTMNCLVIVDDTPRMGAFPPYSGWGGPDARARGEKISSPCGLARAS